ncbi:MAG: hypothetical protein JSU86_12650 [Phycisphaerales bacterium]|nr:MAG: hypothetical protein JSU86_12650 [Phycisphaerales bacterium]
MRKRRGKEHLSIASGALAFSLFLGSLSAGQLRLGPEELVQADGVDVLVPGYSVPSYDYWNGDDLKDLIVGEGSGIAGPGKVRVYLNIGTVSSPQFSGFFHVQSNGSDLAVSASG